MSQQKSSEREFCLCGCGQSVNPGKKYILGHNKKGDQSAPAKSGRFQPGQSGNPKGSPTGSRSKIALNCEQLLEESAGQLTRQLIETALNGNQLALKLCIERIVPIRKSSPISLPGLPKIDSIESATKATGYILDSVVDGTIDPLAGEMLSKITDRYVHALQVVDLEKRLQEMSDRLAVVR